MCLGALRPEDPLRVPLTEIHKAGERSSVLTRQLLAFSRKQLLMSVVLDLNTILEEMEKMLRRLIGEDIALTFLLGTNLWRVKADPGQIEQVVMNIVVNAGEAMPLGGKLLVETKNTVLDESYVQTHPQAPSGENVLLAITDTGCGMAPSIKARIFEPFFTTKGPTKGTGLGLATVYGIVKQSGGHIEVYSEVGQGTTFKIYLPRDKDGAPVAAGLPAPQQIRGGTETILLVEDEEGVRTLAKTVLQKQGYTILEAQNGAEALLLCETYSKTIDLLVTDVVMPNMSGRELGERLATLQPKMKILYMSGYTDDAIVQHGVLESGIPFVQKPFAPEALARKVREVLDMQG
jgi:CheY-like chemotaxis protein